MKELIVNSDESYAIAEDTLFLMYKESRYLKIKISTGQQRTPTQSNSMWLYCDHLSQACNDAGLSVQMVLTKPIDTPWNKNLMMELVWRKIQEAVTGHYSTKNPLRSQYSQIYDVLNRHFINEHNLQVPWPCKENMNNG